MSGLFQILNTLAEQVSTACYPTGTGNASVTGKQITINAGYPIRTQLDKDLQSGFSHVYVYPDPKQRDVTKFERVYQTLSIADPTVFTEVVDNTVTITGTPSINQAVMVINNKTGYAYSILLGDTLNDIATQLASLIPGATSIGPVITISGSYKLDARVSTQGSAAQEISRTDGVFNIYIDSPNPQDRATILDAVDKFLKINFRIVGPDNFYILFFYHDIRVTDHLEKEGIYQANLMYTIQYPTTQIENFMSIAYPFVNSIEVK